MDGSFVALGDGLHRRVIAILAAQALREPSGLTREMSLESLGIDSLGMAEILFAIEEAFDVQVPFNANDPGATRDLSTVGGICDAVEALVSADRG
ncbi:MAG: acyl carrier protein [Proteobacteria bacterium]|nr:acyl carrier protein [Pseudomonadota bacterium]